MVRLQFGSQTLEYQKDLHSVVIVWELTAEADEWSSRCGIRTGAIGANTPSDGCDVCADAVEILHWAGGVNTSRGTWRVSTGDCCSNEPEEEDDNRKEDGCHCFVFEHFAERSRILVLKNVPVVR